MRPHRILSSKLELPSYRSGHVAASKFVRRSGGTSTQLRHYCCGQVSPVAFENSHHTVTRRPSQEIAGPLFGGTSLNTGGTVTVVEDVPGDSNVTDGDDMDNTRTVTHPEDMCCVLCRRLISSSEPAFAVNVWPRKQSLRLPRRAFTCTPDRSCIDEDAATGEGQVLIGTYEDRRFARVHVAWFPPAREEPTPCEGCGRLVALPIDKRRARVTCSPRCLVAVSRSRRTRSVSSLAVAACLVCGETLLNVSPGRRYCSSACKQRAYRRRLISSRQ